MRKLVCKGKVQYWALGISIAIHTIALGVFTGIRLSSPVSGDISDRPVSMHMVETVIKKTVVKPKPKVESIPKVESKPDPKPQVQRMIAEEKPPVEQVPEPVAVVEPAPPAAVQAVHEVEFFGQKSIVQRICYVVDCSGSMYGQMYRVKEQLKQSIMKLDTQQAFCVVFFMDGRQVLMTGSGRLETATVGAKSQALEFIGKIHPAGSTDAAHAMECAMRLRDDNRRGPEIIYFLTDGFDLDDSGSQTFIDAISDLRKSLAPSVVVHTIGFWPEKRDRRMLETLAQQTGGDYIEVQ